MKKLIFYFLSKIEGKPPEKPGRDTDSKEIIKGAGTTLLLKITGLVFAYGFNVYLARLYGAEVMGLFALTLAGANIFIVLSKMGTQTSAVRFTAQFAGQKNFFAVRQVYKRTLHIVLPVSIMFCAAVYFLSPFIAENIFNKPKLTVPLKITSFVLPFSVLTGVNTACLRGLKKIRQAFIFSTVVPPVFNTAGLVVFTYFICKNYLTPVYVNLITAVAVAVYSLVVWNKISRNLDVRENSNSISEISHAEIFKVSATMFMTSAMLLIMGWTDTFMLGIFRPASEVGIYRAAIQVALLTSFTLGAVNSIAAPKFSELYWKNENKALKSVAGFTSKIIFFSAMPVFIVIILFSKTILSVFGAAFIAGSSALIILATGQFVNAICGSVGFLLDMTGNHKIFMIAMITGGTLNIILNLLLIPVYGITGAAIATALSTAVWNIFASLMVYKIYGYWIGYYPGK